jgi:hypothetical protein
MHSLCNSYQQDMTRGIIVWIHSLCNSYQQDMTRGIVVWVRYFVGGCLRGQAGSRSKISCGCNAATPRNTACRRQWDALHSGGRSGGQGGNCWQLCVFYLCVCMLLEALCVFMCLHVVGSTVCFMCLHVAGSSVCFYVFTCCWKHYVFYVYACCWKHCVFFVFTCCCQLCVFYVFTCCWKHCVCQGLNARRKSWSEISVHIVPVQSSSYSNAVAIC